MIIATRPMTVPDTRGTELCADRLTPVPADTEHGGWLCVELEGHLSRLDHRAWDGTQW